MVEEGQVIIDNAEAKYFICSFVEDSLEIQGLHYSLEKGDNEYSIMCISTTENFPKYKSKFEEIAQSFRFE